MVKMVGRIVSLEGCIGAGKTTLLEELKARGYQVFVEDVKDWYKTLNLFYMDPKRWAYTLQVTILCSLCKQYDAIRTLCETHNYVFVERSPETSFIFALNSQSLGYFTAVEFESYTELYEIMKWKPDLQLMLNVPIDVCYERICARKRPCENGLDKAYLKTLIEGHDKHAFNYYIDGQKTPCDIADEVIAFLD